VELGAELGLELGPQFDAMKERQVPASRKAHNSEEPIDDRNLTPIESSGKRAAEETGRLSSALAFVSLSLPLA